MADLRQVLSFPFGTVLLLLPFDVALAPLINALVIWYLVFKTSSPRSDPRARGHDSGAGEVAG